MSTLTLCRFSIEDFLAGDVQLFSPPEIFLHINQAIDSPSADAAHIASIVEQDPALATRVLKVVNSAFYGFPGQVDAIPKAVTILGIQELKMLVMATCVIETFTNLPNGLINMREFWSHSLRTALFAKGLADEHPGKRQLSSAFLGGLLHDIGRIVMYHRAPDLSRAAALQAAAEDQAMFEAETEIFGFCHADVGAGLIELWKLPEVFQQISKYHHRPGDAETFRLETALVASSNTLANNSQRDPASDTLIDPQDPAWVTTKLPYAVIEPVNRRVEENFAITYQQLFG